jgi:Putative lumazine-binding
MKNLLIGVGLSLLLLSTVATSAQNAKIPTDDSSAVCATVTNYIEAYYLGDADRMQKTLHPHYIKHVIHGNIPMRELKGTDMVALVHNGAPDIPQSARTEQVSVLDISGNIASAKLITPGWTDYVTLSKENSGWKILSVVQKIEN